MTLLLLLDGDDATFKFKQAQDMGKRRVGVAGLRDFAYHVEEVTFPFVPFRFGLLEGTSFPVQHGGPRGRGFSYNEFYGLNPRFKVVDLWYSAKDPDGYDYAEFQHEVDLNHPIRKSGKTPVMKYMSLGLELATPDMEGILARELREVY